MPPTFAVARYRQAVRVSQYALHPPERVDEMLHTPRIFRTPDALLLYNESTFVATTLRVWSSTSLVTGDPGGLGFPWSYFCDLLRD